MLLLYGTQVIIITFAVHLRICIAKQGRTQISKNTQEYFGFAEDARLGRVCETQIFKKYAGISKWSQRGGLENFLRVSM